MKYTTRILCLSGLFAALTALGAFIRIPIPPYPVPITLQTFFVFMAGMLLPPKAAFLSMGAYVLLGLMGLPIFTNGGGPAYILDPTFGYLIAFVIAAPLISVCKRRFTKGWVFILSGLGITIGIGAMGVAYMAFLGRFYTGVPLISERAWYLFYIFLPLDLAKFLICMPLATKIAARIPQNTAR